MVAGEYIRDDFAAFQPLLDEGMRGPVPYKSVHGYGLYGHYGWLIVYSALMCYLLDRRLPVISPDAIAYRSCKHESGEDLIEVRFFRPSFFCLPGDPHASDADAIIVPNEARLRELFHEQMDVYMTPAIQLIHNHTGYGQHAMWSQASDWVIGAILEYIRRAGRHDELDTLISQFAKREGSPLNRRNGVIPVHFEDPSTGGTCTEYITDRASCCQWHRFPDAQGDRCSTCPGLARNERIERNTAYYLEERLKQLQTPVGASAA
jgi:hypothetical protein